MNNKNNYALAFVSEDTEGFQTNHTSQKRGEIGKFPAETEKKIGKSGVNSEF